MGGQKSLRWPPSMETRDWIADRRVVVSASTASGQLCRRVSSRSARSGVRRESGQSSSGIRARSLLHKATEQGDIPRCALLNLCLPLDSAFRNLV